MQRSLYFLRNATGSLHFGAKPHSTACDPQYAAMNRPVSLKKDLGWTEKEHLQNVLRKADFWEEFPAPEYCLVRSEFKAAEENQRLDMLYLRDDAFLLPAELKIGGTCMDAHGQLIRYIADLHDQKIDLEWLRDRNAEFLDSIKDSTAREVYRERFENFLASHSIAGEAIKPLPRAGIIMDEDFHPACRRAVRYLNVECGFTMRMIQVQGFVANAWFPEDAEWMYRVDFIEVE